MKMEGEIKNLETLGRFLQQGRLLRGLTQQQLAEKLGISQSYIWQIEAGHPTIYASRLFELMRETGVHLKAEIDQDSD